MKIEMVPLATHQKLWTWCCVCPADENTSEWKKWAFKIFTFILFMGNLSLIAGSILFVCKYVSTDLEGVLHALFQITAFTALCYVTIIEILFRQEISAIFETLKGIHQKCKCEIVHFIVIKKCLI